jgi:hypothetical protein
VIAINFPSPYRRIKAAISDGLSRCDAVFTMRSARSAFFGGIERAISQTYRLQAKTTELLSLLETICGLADRIRYRPNGGSGPRDSSLRLAENHSRHLRPLLKRRRGATSSGLGKNRWPSMSIIRM